MAIARTPTLVIDCPDPTALAAFYGSLLGWEVRGEDDWTEIRPADGSNAISFQQVSGYRAPDWPGQEHPQHMHLDLVVQDLETGQDEVLRRGGRLAADQPGTTFRVFLDPAGHPFCLCLS
ncbi:VOC family protein [Paeniglutamicibacter cryotolerans]|uniref:Putative enzyme related to lactoylglutathione lyase n=1 Tax=Paeniglutamicibacter cryotolerans TaxID=670079 RepID=A0A839QI29_9MICC|nr:VOC family protein [Paeniglutamicibacter cryotolerans]MBB2995829.1 putative enzyme related to lactoylglutathione lyase [Paeniglutamicibacter cryotolerans]